MKLRTMRHKYMQQPAVDAPDPGGADLPGGDAPPAGDVIPAPDNASNDNYFAAIPEDWRDQAVSQFGLDEKQANVLGRYPTYDKFVGSFFEQRDMISKGEHKKGLPENPTDEQLAEYRQQNGIPETPEAYELQLGEGLVLGEQDAAVMASLYPVAHKHNVAPAVLSELVSGYLKEREVATDTLMAKHGQDRNNAERVLKSTWGNEFNTNANVVASVLNRLPAVERILVMGGEKHEILRILLLVQPDRR